MNPLLDGFPDLQSSARANPLPLPKAPTLRHVLDEKHPLGFIQNHRAHGNDDCILLKP
jgi:hypothetical protein